MTTVGSRNFDVSISNPEKLEKELDQIKEAGPESVQVLADFDRTLTTAFVDGEKVSSVISVLRDGDYISNDYAQEAAKLFNKYHPIENDINLSSQERKAAMEIWWREHFKLLIDSGLTINHTNQAVEAGRIRLREGVKEFIDLLDKEKIPLVIVSSTALGVESIRFILESNKLMNDNIEIISNKFIWDEEGRAIDVEEPIVHLANKDEVVFDFELKAKLQARKNIFLLGDNLEDKKMVGDLNYDKLITIGFLNENVEKYINRYRKEFDVVIKNDGNFDYINKLLTSVI